MVPQFYRLYLKDCMIRVPWLNINYMSPVNLLTPNDDSLIRAAIAELGIDGPVSCQHDLINSTRFPLTRPYQLPEHIQVNPQLANLIKTFAYHKKKQETIPMSAQQVDQTTRIVNELSSTLKTILRL